MTALEEKIKAKIEAEGSLPLDTFMQIALQDPEHGYYIKQDPLGRGGDFITAPEISQIFGEMIGLWAADFTLRNSFPIMHLVELGPGRATLMRDALRVLHIPSKPLTELIHVHLVETSPILRKVQQETLAQSGFKITWHDDITQLPKVPCCILANEFFDALPIKQFVKQAKGWKERGVRIENKKLAFTLKTPQTAIDLSHSPQLEDIPTGEIIEKSAKAEQIMATLCAHIMSYGGIILAIDYGYRAHLSGDSFQALYRHQAVSPLSYIGDADLTAHVNFAALAKIAENSGTRVYGPVTQAHFLTQLGAKTRCLQLQAKASQQQKKQIASAFERLVAPDQMGHLFKVLGVAHPKNAPPEGF